MTVLVMPDVIGHLVVRQGRDCRSGPAMTVFVVPDVIGIVMPDVIGHLVLRQGRLPVGAGNDGFRHARPDRASRAAAGKGLPVGAGNDGEKGLPVGAGNDGE